MHAQLALVDSPYSGNKFTSTRHSSHKYCVRSQLRMPTGHCGERKFWGGRSQSAGPVATGVSASAPHSAQEPSYRGASSRPSCASAREITEAVTPDPQDVSNLPLVSTPAERKAAWRPSGDSILPSSPSRSPNGKLREPGM